MVVQVSQFPMAEVRIQLVRRPQITNGLFSLVTFKLTKQKLITCQMRFRKLRIEFLGAIDLLLRKFHPRRRRWFEKHRQIDVGVSKLGVCQREVRIGLNGPFVKLDCAFYWRRGLRYTLVKDVSAFQIK